MHINDKFAPKKKPFLLVWKADGKGKVNQSR